MNVAKKIVKAEIKSARALLGAGWRHVSDDIREGLVARGVLFALWNQDESISDARRVALLDECVREIRAWLKRENGE